MNSRRTAFLLIPVAILTGSLFSRSGGTIPGSSSIAADSARRGPSCTSCHSGTIGNSGVATALAAGAHSLALSETVAVTLQVTGGPSGTDGGFAGENTAGTFVAGANTQINGSGRGGQYITHSNANHRSWSFQYTAANTPGLAMLYAVGMASDGGGGRSNDPIAFHGSDPTASVCTPVYIGVNAAGNQRHGQGCVGSFGNWPVLYSDVTPSIGNSSYVLRLAGAAPNASALFLLGLPRTAPLDLTAIGAAGCGVWVDAVASVGAVTSNGNAQRGEGTAAAPLPIPNDAGLRGAILGSQVAIVDAATGRTLPITMTAGLLMQIQ